MAAGVTRREKKEQLNVKDDEHQQKEATFIQWNYESPPCRSVAELQQCNKDELETELKQILDLQNPDTCMREAALLDFYSSVFSWAKESNFSPTQTSFSVALLQTLLENIRDKHMCMVENLGEFAKALAPACQNPMEDDSSPLLDVEDAKELTSYFKTSLFQKYNLFQFLLTTPREESLSSEAKTIEVFTYPDTPLEESVPANLYLE
ncbi:hypothetical protein JOB18_047362 [Solea senegalensis]|uniref:Uncharacterized protein n=1 Tax=Solea senegalensis TaxID=28829 RepID=A0AAV6RR01_SOLSE|nr:ciliary-associated calcium-binding coiled-coil protein 1 [Solea senegalensis]KAG7507861.1 hypothetical protein JOB18_047362 [Solea senegalensis]